MSLLQALAVPYRKEYRRKYLFWLDLIRLLQALMQIQNQRFMRVLDELVYSLVSNHDEKFHFRREKQPHRRFL